MKTISVKLPHRAYDILIEPDLLAAPELWLDKVQAPARTLALVSDENAWRECGPVLKNSLHSSGFQIAPLILPAGESSKSLEGLRRVYDFFASLHLNRSSVVLALGGGVVGDLTGFAAATYMRGIAYVQIPTTLLAQVDSSVGGKTAINLPWAKNMVGAFHQPRLVLIDPRLLQSLPPRELRCGLGEVVKYGAIASAELFESLAGAGPLDYEDIIARCCAIKAEIVAEDEFDHGRRALLNFGHSFGHALERHSNYESCSHGEAVAVGMVIASALGERLGLTEPLSSRRLAEIMKINGLNPSPPCSPLKLMPALALDKKSGEGSLNMVLLEKIGCAFSRSFTLSELEKILREMEEQWTNLC